MVIVAIDDGHIDVDVTQGACGCEPAESGADDHDMRTSGHMQSADQLVLMTMT